MSKLKRIYVGIDPGNSGSQSIMVEFRDGLFYTQYTLKPCDNPLCNREARQGVLFCCQMCEDAYSKGHEPEHSPQCDERHERRNCAPSKWLNDLLDTRYIP